MLQRPINTLNAQHTAHNVQQLTQSTMTISNQFEGKSGMHFKYSMDVVEEV